MAKADYGNLCIEYARSVAEDLTGLLGVNVRLKGPKVTMVTREEEADTEESVTYTPCSSKDDSGNKIFLVVPSPDAVSLGALLMAFDAAVIEAKRKEGLDEEMLDAFGEVMNMASAILSRICESMDLAGVQRDETREIESPALDTEWLCEGTLRRARWSVTIPDLPDAQIDLLMPASVLSAWFGEEVASAGGAAAGGGARSTASASDGAGSAGADETSELPEDDAAVVLIDASEEDREAAEALEDELGRPIWAVDPAQLNSEGFTEFSEAGAVIVAWDLGICSGLDVLRALLAAPETSGVRIGLASPEPTRRMVTAGLRNGASTFLMKPYQAEEIRSRLFPWQKAQEAGASTAEAADEDACQATSSDEDATADEESSEEAAVAEEAGGDVPEAEPVQEEQAEPA